MLRIWELNTDPDKCLFVQTVDLRYFWDRFDGHPMSNTWATPPYETLNRSKKVADFTSWQMGSKVFLVSRRARDAMLQLDDGAVEFLAFGRFKGRDLFAANVLRTEDFLDRENTDFMPGAGTPVRVTWRADLPDELPPIFKVKGGSETYVSEAFGRKAVELRLTGLRLADPGKNRFEQVIRREDINVFPGL